MSEKKLTIGNMIHLHLVKRHWVTKPEKLSDEVKNLLFDADAEYAKLWIRREKLEAELNSCNYRISLLKLTNEYRSDTGDCKPLQYVMENKNPRINKLGIPLDWQTSTLDKKET